MDPNNVAYCHYIPCQNLENLHFLQYQKKDSWLTVFGSLDRRLAVSLCSHCWHHCKRVVGPANMLSLSASSRSRFSRRTADATTLSVAGGRDIRPFMLRFVLLLYKCSIGKSDVYKYLNIDDSRNNTHCPHAVNPHLYQYLRTIKSVSCLSDGHGTWDRRNHQQETQKWL